MVVLGDKVEKLIEKLQDVLEIEEDIQLHPSYSASDRAELLQALNNKANAERKKGPAITIDSLPPLDPERRLTECRLQNEQLIYFTLGNFSTGVFEPSPTNPQSSTVASTSVSVSLASPTAVASPSASAPSSP